MRVDNVLYLSTTFSCAHSFKISPPDSRHLRVFTAYSTRNFTRATCR